MLKSFSRLSIKVTLEGGSVMSYRIEQKEPLVLFGYKARFTGSPKDRKLQDHNFICDTRLKHAALQYMAHDADTTYNVIDHISDDGYDFYVASYVGEEDRDLVLGMFGEDVAGWFEQILIPGGTYLVCEGDRCSILPIMRMTCTGRLSPIFCSAPAMNWIGGLRWKSFIGSTRKGTKNLIPPAIWNCGFLSSRSNPVCYTKHATS